MRVTILALWLVASRAFGWAGYWLIRIPFLPWIMTRRALADRYSSYEVVAALCTIMSCGGLIGFMVGLFAKKPPEGLFGMGIISLYVFVQCVLGWSSEPIAKSWQKVTEEAAQQIQQAEANDEALLRPSDQPIEQTLVRPA